MGKKGEDEETRGAAAPRALIRQDLRDLLTQLAVLTETPLELRKDESEVPEDSSSAPLPAAGRPTGWKIVAQGKGPKRRLTARIAAEILGSQIAAETRPSGRPEEERHHERRLNFLYEMSQRVGSLLDEQEICNFVVERVAWLMDCARASLMLYDPESDSLKIRASMGVPEHIAATTAVKPGERISGKVFESGREVFVGEGDPMPSESLGVRELEDAPSLLSVPLTIPADPGSEQQILGVLNLTRKKGGDAFTPSDHKLGAALAAHTASQVRNCRFISAEHERRQLERELKIAAEIQLSLLPKEPLSVRGVEVAGLSRPAQHVGGDFFDYWEQEGRICLVVADVTGHDLGAALMATAFRAAIRTESTHRESVGQMMFQINRGICPDLQDSELLLTACYLELNPDSGLLTYVSCGHPQPMLLRDSRELWLETSAPLFGTDCEAEFEERTLQLEGGDALVVYTDGVVEAGLPRNEHFGRDGLLRSVQGAPRQPPLALAKHIMNAVEQHAGTFELRDDVTILVATFGGK